MTEITPTDSYNTDFIPPEYMEAYQRIPTYIRKKLTFWEAVKIIEAVKTDKPVHKIYVNQQNQKKLKI